MSTIKDRNCMNLTEADDIKKRWQESTEELLKKREFQKNSYFCFIDYAKAFNCMDHNKLWKIRKEMEIPDNMTRL